jgi:hypothetical protein
LALCDVWIHPRQAGELPADGFAFSDCYFGSNNEAALLLHYSLLRASDGRMQALTIALV